MCDVYPIDIRTVIGQQYCLDNAPFILLIFSPSDCDDVVVARVGTPATLVCSDTTVRGAVAINWMARSLETDEWQLVLSASERQAFSGSASKASMRLTDQNFQDTGVFSLLFHPKMEDGGFYLCLIKQQDRKLKERIIHLTVITGRNINGLYSSCALQECLDSTQHR